VVFTGYGIVSRVLRSAVDQLRREGVEAGLIRPVSLFPFPYEAFARLASRVERFVVVEMSTGQMVEDVRLAVEGRAPVEFHGRTGGNLPSAQAIVEAVLCNRMALS
jgi:pyruvate/2-oxoacid:ferredoxin oxidoreductase alpha subunit